LSLPLPGGTGGAKSPSGGFRGRGVLVQAWVLAGKDQSAFVLKFPEEGGEFASNGDDAFTVHEAAGSQGTVTFTKAVLHSP